MKKQFAPICLSILILLLIPTFFSPTIAPAKEKNQIVLSQRMDAETLDWAMTRSMESNVVARNIFDRLVLLDKNYKYVPMLATSWKVVDSNTWHFTLRKGVKFHNGEIFDANSVKFSIDRQKSPDTKSVWAWVVKNISEVKILDDYRIEIKTIIPQASLLDQLLYVNIVPPNTMKTFVNPDFGLNPVGTGPYKFVEWIKDEKIVLEANDNYWRGAPKIKKLIFRPIPEASSRVSALKTGEIDAASDIPPNYWEDLRKGDKTRIFSKVGTMVYLGVNALQAPFDNIKVRKALNHTIDIKSIIDSILSGSADRMNGPFHVGTIGYDSTIAPYSFDLNRAKKLLQEAGYANGFDTVLSFVSIGMEGATNLNEVAESIAFQLKKVGINVKLEPMEIAVWMGKYQNKEFKMYLSTWPERWEPDVYLRALFHSKARGYYYKNTLVDDLLDQGINTFGPDERAKVYRKLHRTLYDDAPWVFLYKQKVGYGAGKSVNFEAPHDGYLYPYDYSFNP